MDKGYYSLGLLNAWSLAGEHRHWMLSLRKGAQYEEIRKLGKGDHLVKLKTSPQARKKWPGLGNEVTARLLTVTLTPEPDNKIPAPVQVEQTDTPPDSLCCELVLSAGTLRLKGKLTPALLQTLIREMKGCSH